MAFLPGVAVRHVTQLLALLQADPGAVPDFEQDKETAVVQWVVPVGPNGPEAVPRHRAVVGASLDADRALDRRRTVPPHSWLVLLEASTGRIVYWVPVDDPLVLRLEAFPEREGETIRGGRRRIGRGTATARLPFLEQGTLLWLAPDDPTRPIYPGTVYAFGSKPSGEMVHAAPPP